MNKTRRKALGKIIDLISEARTLLEDIRDEEQEAFDNMPESLQASERGETMEDAISTMDDIISSLEDAESELEELVG